MVGLTTTVRTIAHVSAMRSMEDSTNWQAIPTTTPIVAGYVPPSGFAWPPQAWARFPNSLHVKITPTRSVWGKGIQVIDVENGDASPGDVPGWATDSRSAGQEPTSYMNVASWPDVITACLDTHVAVPQFWVADWDGVDDLPSVTVGGVTYTAVAHQLADPPGSGGDYDVSVVAAHWPGVDPGEPVTDPNAPSADGRTASLFAWTDTVGDAWANAPAGVDKTERNQMKAWFTAQFAALAGALSADEATLLAAIKAQPTGGQVDVPALAAALVPLLSTADAQALMTELRTQINKP